MELTVPSEVRRAELEAARESAALVVTPHPLSLHDQRIYSRHAAALQPGETLASFLARHGVEPGRQWVVTIGGVWVHEMHWSRVKPRPGHLVECRRVPERQVLQLAAIVALSYFTFGAGGIGGGSFLGMTGAVGKIAAGIAYMAGSAVINKLLGPKATSAPEQTSNPTYSLTAGGQNQARLWQPMTLVLGEPHLVPDLGAQSYTYFANGEQYLWQIFNVGINCADVSDLRIGQTALGSYQGVNVLRSGMASNNSDFPALGTSVDTVAGGLLDAPSHPGTSWVTRSSSAGTVRLAVDLVAVLFNSNRSEGVMAERYCDLVLEYRPVGGSGWFPFTDATSEVPAGWLRLRNATQKPLRVTVEKQVHADQYEVRLLKHSGNTNPADSYESNQVEWVALKSYQVDTADYAGQSRLAVQIQASGQLNGSLTEFNLRALAAPMPCWDGNAWVAATSRETGLCNPGAILLMLARGIFHPVTGRRLAGLGYSDDRIDIDGLKAFMVHCRAHGLEFDHVVQDATSVGDLMEAVAAAGMGQIDWPDGKLGVVFYAEDDPVTGVINMGSIKARSFVVDYQTLPTADELELQYRDRERDSGWTSVRATVPGVTSPRSTARTQMVGVTGQAHAARMLRFLMAQNIYQRKTVTLEMDLEAMTYRRGQVVALSHDLTQWGYGGRLMACAEVGGVVRLTLDDTAPGAIPPGFLGRYIGLRLAGERQMRVFRVRPFAGAGRVIELEDAWPADATLPGSAAGNPAHDCLWVYDFKPVPGQLMRVTSIEPSMDGARLTLVPELAEFWDYVDNGTYTPPPNNSRLASSPVIASAVVTEELARQGNTFFTELSVDYDVIGNFRRAELWGSTSGFDRMTRLGTSSSQRISWRGGLAEAWSLELRAYSETRAAEPVRLLYAVRGLSAPPPNVQAVTVSGQVVTWPAVNVPDLAGYVVRFNYGQDSWWEYAAPLHTGLVTETPYRLERTPVGECTVMVKAVDTSGNESEAAASAVYVFAEPAVANVLLSYDQHPTFTGTITDGALVAGSLLANATDNFWAPDDAPFWAPSEEGFWGTSLYAAMVYEFAVSPTEAGTLVLQLGVTGSYRVEYQTGGAEPIWSPGADDFWAPADDAFWGVASAWQLWPGSLVVDGALGVRFRITTAPGAVRGVINTLTAVLDVPDVAERLAAVAISSAGTRLPITQSYHAIKTVHLTVHSGATGTSARIVDKDATIGPLVQVINAAGTAVAGTVDADIQGY